jgi:hypothetical protein
MSERKPEYVGTLETVQRQLQERIRTTIPATVIKFYPGSPTQAPSVDVQPAPFVRDRTGAVFAIKQVQRVPVKYPGGGGFEIVWPLVPGDTVVLHVADRALSEWRRTGAAGDTRSARMHNISDAFADPSTGPDTAPATVTATKFTLRGPGGIAVALETGGTVNLGAEFGASLVALATKVNAYTAKMDILLRTTWVPVPTDGGAALKTAYLAAFPTPPASVAAAKVRAT